MNVIGIYDIWYMIYMIYDVRVAHVQQAVLTLARHTWPYKPMPMYIYLLHWLVTSSYHVGHSAKQRWLLICGHPKLEFWPAAPGILHHAPSFSRVPYIMPLEHGVGWVSHSPSRVFYACASFWDFSFNDKIMFCSICLYCRYDFLS